MRERSNPEKQATPCAAARNVVYEFLDEELPPSESAGVSGHLGCCPPCASYFRFERAYLLALKRGGSPTDAPPELRERIRAALASRERRRPTD